MRYRCGEAGKARHGCAVGAALLTLGGCVSLPPRLAGLAAPAPAFVPEKFFAGRTEGDGTLAIVFRRPRPVHVTGAGHVEPDGTIVLAQSVEQAGKPPAQRRWSIRPTAPGRYAGTLTDASGPVTGEQSGNMLRLRYRMSGGLVVEQRLYLRPDGRSAANRMTVRKFGLVVAVLAETIRKLD